MHQLKLRKITAIMLVALSMHQNAFSMDSGLWEVVTSTASSVASTTTSVASTAMLKLKKGTAGQYPVFRSRLDSGELLAANVTDRNHDYDRAAEELLAKRKMSLLVALIRDVNKQNENNPGNMIRLSQDTEERIRKPLKEHYEQEKQIFLAHITHSITELVEQIRIDHESLTDEARTKDTELTGIKAAIACVRGTDPNDDLLKELVAVLTKKIELVFKPREDVLDDTEKGNVGGKKSAKKAKLVAADDSDDDNNDDDSSDSEAEKEKPKAPLTQTKKTTQPAKPKKGKKLDAAGNNNGN